MKRRLNIGIIPDGNRRWAAEKKLPVWEGHREGAKRAREILYHILDGYREIKTVTIWAFSTENFGRTDAEKKTLFKILQNNIGDLMSDENVRKNRIKINVLGTRFDEMPSSLKDTAKQTMEVTKDYGKKIFNIATGYGGRFEIFNAAMGFAHWLMEKPVIKDIGLEAFEKFLEIKEPLDILIRTGGEQRLSGFMLYQAAYSELFFIDRLWPDFRTADFDSVMKEFYARKRRFGK